MLEPCRLVSSPSLARSGRVCELLLLSYTARIHLLSPSCSKLPSGAGLVINKLSQSLAETSTFVTPSPFYHNVWCVRDLQILDPHTPPQGVSVRGHAGRLQGYLAHDKPPPPLGPPYEPRYDPTAGSYGVAVSYKRGTPVINGLSQREEVAERGENVRSIPLCNIYS